MEQEKEQPSFMIYKLCFCIVYINDHLFLVVIIIQLFE